MSSTTSAATESIKRIKVNAKLAEEILSEINKKIVSIELHYNKSLQQNNGQEIKSSNSGSFVSDEEIRKVEAESLKLVEEIERLNKELILKQIYNGMPVILNSKIAPPSKGGEGDGSKAKVGPVKTEEKVNKSSSSGEIKEALQQPPPQGPQEKKAESSQPQGQSQGKKGKKGKGGGGGDGGNESGGPAAVVNDAVDVSRLDFRIGKIINVEKHPEADALYIEKIDIGEPEPRTVVSGLVKFVPIEQMQNRMVVVLCNLKPSKLRGTLSEAMVMCASTPEKVEILNPPPGVVPGDVVDFEGFIRNPDPVLNPKKKIWESVAPDLKMSDSKVATYKGIPFIVKGKGEVTSTTLANVIVK